jgi:hypothetical protein
MLQVSLLRGTTSWFGWLVCWFIYTSSQHNSVYIDGGLQLTIFPGGHPSKYQSWSTRLNCSQRATELAWVATAHFKNFSDSVAFTAISFNHFSSVHSGTFRFTTHYSTSSSRNSTSYWKPSKFSIHVFNHHSSVETAEMYSPYTFQVG